MGRLTKESRERSRSDSEMTSSAKKMADDESAMETDLLQSTVSVPAATTAKAPSGSTGQYKKRLLHKYEQEQEDHDRKFTKARLSPPDHPEPSPPAVAEVGRFIIASFFQITLISQSKQYLDSFRKTVAVITIRNALKSVTNVGIYVRRLRHSLPISALPLIIMAIIL